MDDIDQMEWNEYQRLERAIDARKKRIEALEKGSPDIRQRNFRYVLDFNFDYSTYPALPPAQTRTFVVKSESDNGKKTRFYVKSIEMTYALLASQVVDQGPPVVAGPGQRFFISPDYRRNFFDFTWRIRDTGSDREWQNTDMPSQLLMTGNVNPLLLGNGHCMLSAGTEVSMQIVPTFSGNLLDLGFLDDVQPLTDLSSHSLQVCFVGVEVIL